MSGLAEMSKVNVDLLNLFIAIITSNQTYRVIIVPLASIVLKKNQLFKKNHH